MNVEPAPPCDPPDSPPLDPFALSPPPGLEALFTPPPAVAAADVATARAERDAAREERARANFASVYSPAARAAEKARRAALRAVFVDGPLKGVPPLGEASPTNAAVRPDLWPPRPRRPPGVASRHGDTWSRRRLTTLVKRFAKARGVDFGVLEFCRWAGVASSTLYRHGGSWPALRVAAGLSPAMTPPDRRARTLAALLRTLHLNRNRRRPLTGAQLARSAGLSRSVIGAYGGVRHLRDLYRQWVQASVESAEGEGESAEGEGERTAAAR